MNQSATIGVVVALAEEFELLQESLGNHQASGIDEVSDNYFYKYLQNDMQIEGPIVLSFVGKTGPGDAATSTERLVAKYSPSIIVSIGISGALSSSVDLADVVVAETVDDYLERPRISANTPGGEYKILPSGGMYPTERKYTEYARNLRFSKKDQFEKLMAIWNANIETSTKALPKSAKDNVLAILSEPRRLHVGSVASGAPLVAATRFKNQVIDSRDRSHLAVDMESAAVGRICNQLRLPHVCVRGISDYADERKRQLEAETKGAVRELAMRNAISTLGVVLQSPRYSKKK